MTVRHIAVCASLLIVAAGCSTSGAGSASSPEQRPRPAVATSNGPTHTAGRVGHAARRAAFLRVKLKMPMHQVEMVLGHPPFRVGSTAQGSCWLYGRSPDDLAGGAVCFTNGRVSFVATPQLASATLGSATGQ